MEDQFEVEISSWARIVHTDEEKPPGGTYTAYDRETEDLVGFLSYWHLDAETIMFKTVGVQEPYRRRRVATALLRYLNLHHPHARINPGIRNPAGEAFMKHILTNEAEKVATNGVVTVPLRTMMHPTFSPDAALRRMRGEL